MPGNTLGDRRYYAYQSDGQVSYKYQTDSDLGEAVGGIENDSLPNLPRRFRPRGVYIEAEVDGAKRRKFLICPDPLDALYGSESSQNVTIDTVTWQTTGRRGERLSFGRNPL